MVTNDSTISLDIREKESSTSPYQLRQTLSRHNSVGNSVAWSPDGNFVATGGNDGSIRIWDTKSGQEVRMLVGHRNAVRSVAWSPDGRWLASGSADNTVKMWEAQSGQELRMLVSHRNAVTSVAWSPDGRWLASGSADNTVRLWAAQGGQEVRMLLRAYPKNPFALFSFNELQSYSDRL
ncbi:MAG: WD40 repeat domain-containing protein [Deltaproteobacteria bacterium]|nr:WD40 repeat domain-containing protein [Deltaproteobacteria bacterium]